MLVRSSGSSDSALINGAVLALAARAEWRRPRPAIVKSGLTPLRSRVSPRGIIESGEPRDRRRGRRLGMGKARQSRVVGAAEFAVEIGGLRVERREGLDGAWIFGRPVETGPREALQNIFKVAGGLRVSRGVGRCELALRSVQAGAIPQAIPEPSTWALMRLGFATLGFAGWRAAKERGAMA
jgi:hypothetical protein